MIRPHDPLDGALADQIAHGVEIDAVWSFHMAAGAASIERDIAVHRLLDRGDRFWKRQAENARDEASFWWDAALVGDFERGAMP